MPHALDPALIRAAIGRLRFAWFPSEAGAPSVDTAEPFGTPDALADLASIAGETRAEALYTAAVEGLAPFIAEAALRLPPGRYILAPDDAAQLRAAAAFAAWLHMPVELGLDAEGGFAYTAEHVALLPRLRWLFDGVPGQTAPTSRNEDTDEPSWPVPLGDYRRPYGDITRAEIDMAEALGLPVRVDAFGRASLSPEVKARMVALHQTTPAALRVLVLHGSADRPGTLGRQPT